MVKKLCGKYTTIGYEEHEEYVIVDSFSDGGINWHYVDQDTICQCTGLTDKNGNTIYENNITKLVLPSGEIRYFKVLFTNAVRNVQNHPDFVDGHSKVEISGIVFEWDDYKLFPCIDENGTSDVSKMEVVGNVFDNPELLLL